MLKNERRPPKLLSRKKLFGIVLIFVVCVASYLVYTNYNQKLISLTNQITELLTQKDEHLRQLEEVRKELDTLKSQDQIVVNKTLQEEIANIQKTYNQAVVAYENLIELKDKTNKTQSLDEIFTKALTELSKKNYASAAAAISDLNNKIKEEETKLAATVVIPANIPQSNTPPGAGYSRQQVSSDAGTFMISLVAADISSTKVIVDTASDSDCGNNCPVLPLSTYVSRSGGFAGINGSYFCPASYPSCAGKTNSFDLLAMNKNKYYFNSSNNVYSSNPAVIFGSGYVRFVSSASQWGRDTGVDGVISNYPLLVEGGNVKFGGDDDPKKGSKGNRSFIANKGTTVYIGVVHNVTVAESARVLKALGVENAMNLDSGGSTALWSGGYKVGPGRDIPNAIVFVKR